MNAVLIGLITAVVPSILTVVKYTKSEAGRLRLKARKQIKKARAADKAASKALRFVEDEISASAKRYSRQQKEQRIRRTPIEALKKAGAASTRITAIQHAGLRNLHDLRRHSPGSLQRIRGVGPTTAYAVCDARNDLLRKIESDPVAIPRTDQFNEPETKDICKAAWMWMYAKYARHEASKIVAKTNHDLREIYREIRDKTSILKWLTRRIPPVSVLEAEDDLRRIDKSIAELDEEGYLDKDFWQIAAEVPSEVDLENDFRSRYSDYAATIEAALCRQTRPFNNPDTFEFETPESSRAMEWGQHRGLNKELIDDIESHPLNTSGLKLTLRRYQTFGAKYILSQKRTVLGDEMGLGKTVQAMAAMTHLNNTSNGNRFLVICPASIVPNWIRELNQRTEFRIYPLTGDQKKQAFDRWVKQGGVAIASYASLRTLTRGRLSRSNLTLLGCDIDLSIIDEAHYAKNPEAGRSRAVNNLANSSARICLMTGTPLENKLSEFRSILRLASPEVARRIPNTEDDFVEITDIVAPVYLRRNQEDVLKELPDKIEKEEWVDLYDSDLSAYKAAIISRNYMAVRRAATCGNSTGVSAKLGRLEELLDIYREMGKKVVIYSFFLDVLSCIDSRFNAMGTLRGGTTPKARMELIDRFQSRPGYELLLGQIEAGGIGLNLQAASVVILMEPQWKPSTENQAIARLHRMGQTEQVIVHRMLALNSVDEHMVKRLKVKQEIFDRHVRGSALKDASTEATERDFEREVIESELARLNSPSSQ